MLVLSRKVDEKIIIADVIEVVVVEIRDGRVKLGITAPVDITIHREEVWVAIHSPEEDFDELAKLTEKAF